MWALKGGASYIRAGSWGGCREGGVISGRVSAQAQVPGGGTLKNQRKLGQMGLGLGKKKKRTRRGKRRRRQLSGFLK